MESVVEECAAHQDGNVSPAMTDAYADHAVPLGLREAAEVTYHCNTYGKGTDDGGDAHGNGNRRADRPGVPDVAERNHGACFPNGRACTTISGYGPKKDETGVSVLDKVLQKLVKQIRNEK